MRWLTNSTKTKFGTITGLGRNNYYVYYTLSVYSAPDFEATLIFSEFLTNPAISLDVSEIEQLDLVYQAIKSDSTLGFSDDLVLLDNGL